MKPLAARAWSSQEAEASGGITRAAYSWHYWNTFYLRQAQVPRPSQVPSRPRYLQETRMPIGISDEHSELAASVRKWAESQGSIAAIRAAETDPAALAPWGGYAA